VRDLSRRPHRGRQANRIKAWFEKGQGAARLKSDKALVLEAYPTLEYHIDKDTGALCLKGVFAYDSKSGIRDEIKLRVVFPFLYPEREPRAYDVESHFPHTLERHFYDDGYHDGRCCLWLPPQSKWKASDQDGLLVFLDELALFFERQLIFDATGKWPGSEYAHGNTGYHEWIEEMLGGNEVLVIKLGPVLANQVNTTRNDPCPCDSGRKYKRCHLSTVDHIRRKVDARVLQALFGKTNA
jgi:SEC-C motif